MKGLDWLGHSNAQQGLSDSPLGVVMKGALAGFTGTLVLTLAVKAAQWVVKRAHGDDDEQQSERGEAQAGIGAAQALASGQVEAPFLDPSTEIFVQKVATGLFGASLSGGTLKALGVGMHFVYGSFWGAVYGVIQSSFHLPAALHGLLYGLIVWLIGPVTLVPAMHIMPPPQQQGVRNALMVIGFHIAYGLGLGLTFDAFTPSAPGKERRR
jgi:hypothetical protein